MLNILLVEDNKDLALSIIDYLECKKISCDYAATGIEGTKLIKDNHYDVIILDINMPDMDGLTLCEEIRLQGVDTPVLMLTARDTLENKIEGFNAGTDDYMVKPFEIEELIIRLQALSKRRSGQVSTLSVGPISLNLKKRTGQINNEHINLTPIIFKLLEILLRASPNPVSRDELLQKVWGDHLPDSNKLRVHIHNLRKVLNSGQADHLLTTISGYGFCIKA